MNCGDILSYIGSWASIIGIPLTMVTILIAKSLNDHIIETRFKKRIVQIVAKMREYQKSGNTEKLRNEISILTASIETTFGCIRIYTSVRIRKLYFESKKQMNEDPPSIQILEGLLANYKALHAEVK